MANYRGLTIDTTVFPVISVSTSIQRNPISEVTMGSVGETAIYGGTYNATGAIEANYRSDIEPLMINLFGGAIANGIVELPSTPYLTNAKIYDEYNNGISFASFLVTSMDMSLNVNDMCKTSFNWIGIKGTTSTGSETSASYTNPVYLFYNAVLTIDSSTIYTTSLSLNITRPIDTDYYILGSPFLQDFIQNGPVTISGTLNFAPKDWSTINTAINSNSTDTIAPSGSNTNGVTIGSTGTLVITLNTPTGSLGKTITISRIKLSDFSISGQGRSRFEKSLNFRGLIDPSNNYNITIT